MKIKDGRVVARENEVRVLRALHRCGWLRTRDLSVVVWQEWARNPQGEPDLRPPTPTDSGLRMAQRTLQRLRANRQVLSSRAPDGSQIYALAEAGARRLQQIGVAALSGKDLMRTFSAAYFKHRCIANQIAIAAIVQGFRVATEREIAQGLWLGGQDGIAGKRPDVLVRADGRVWWLEVERSRKNAKDYSRLLHWLGIVGQDALRPSESRLLEAGMRWAKVIFICTAAFRGKLLRDLAAAGWDKAQIDRLVMFEVSLYKFEDITFK